MKRSLKFLTAITLSLLLVFGSSLGAFAAKNTSINLHADGDDYVVFVVLEGNYSSKGVYNAENNETKVPMTGGSLYTVTDFSSNVQPVVKHFIIDDEIWNIPENIKEGKEGKDGSGTINYWMKGMPTKNVNYDKNNYDATGTEPSDSYDYFFGETVEVMGKGNLALEGYNFGGWNTNEGGTGDTYKPGEYFLMPSEDVTLYAVWDLIPTYSLTYDGNGATSGSVPEDPNKYYENAPANVLDNTGNLDLVGYKFMGWTINDDGTGEVYTAGDSFNMPADDVTLYAVWELIPIPTYSLTYDGNGATSGSVPEDPNKYYENAPAKVLDNTGNLDLVGYKFMGWTFNDDGTGEVYTAGDSFNMPADDVTLYAVWELIPTPTYSLTYDGNGATSGSVPEDFNKYYENAPANVLDNTGNLDLVGYKFMGWTFNNDGTGEVYKAGDSFNMPDGDVTLYAVWELIPTYSLTYDGNGATSGNPPASQMYYQTSSKVTVLSNTGNFKITGMYFNGWNTESNGSGTHYLSGDPLTIITTDVVLYAQWSESIPTVGTITIEKVITGDEPLPGTIFEFRIIGYDGEDSFVINDEPIYIVGNGSTLPYEVPAGLICVEEINIPPNYTLIPDGPRDVVLDVEFGFDQIVRFENEYKEPRGSITVNKTLTGDTPIPDRTFTFRLVGPAGEKSTTTELSRLGAGSVTFSGLTYGTYTLTEIGLPSNFSIVSGSNVQLMIHDETPNVTANITNRYTEPTPPPPPPTPETGVVRVHYIDTEEVLLDDIFEFSSPIGNNYNTAARDFEGKQLIETPENASGTIIDGVIDVFYVYSPGVEPLFTLEVEEETPLGAPVVPEEEIVLTEPIPLAPLPQTGQLPVELFYGLGSVISMIGIAFRKSWKNR